MKHALLAVELLIVGVALAVFLVMLGHRLPGGWDGWYVAAFVVLLIEYAGIYRLTGSYYMADALVGLHIVLAVALAASVVSFIESGVGQSAIAYYGGGWVMP